MLEKLGSGWDGEVYKVLEISTGIERAAKFFLPLRNRNNKSARLYAKKLHKLRSCPLLIQYFTQDTVYIEDELVTFLISEYVEGETLNKFLLKQRGKKLTPFQAIFLLHSLVKGMEDVHGMREYHGDLHSDNIIVRRYGLGFDLKVLDLFHWGNPTSENFKDDIVDLIRLFYDTLGGQKYYQRQPKEIKAICCGLKRSLILDKFKNLSQLRIHLENISWSTVH